MRQELFTCDELDFILPGEERSNQELCCRACCRERFNFGDNREGCFQGCEVSSNELVCAGLEENEEESCESFGVPFKNGIPSSSPSEDFDNLCCLVTLEPDQEIEEAFLSQSDQCKISPTSTPTLQPTITPTNNATLSPSNITTFAPSEYPINTPTRLPTTIPSSSALDNPTLLPSFNPTKSPTEEAGKNFTNSPSLSSSDNTEKTRPKSNLKDSDIYIILGPALMIFFAIVFFSLGVIIMKRSKKEIDINVISTHKENKKVDFAHASINTAKSTSSKFTLRSLGWSNRVNSTQFENTLLATNVQKNSKFDESSESVLNRTNEKWYLDSNEFLGSVKQNTRMEGLRQGDSLVPSESSVESLTYSAI
eukprot:snap_masked-scaffold_3-processed-gene-8.10-mRNA-1 protein AED:0.60 eAED:0.60 QI:0/-1/0/1/-1/1/1/0/365